MTNYYYVMNIEFAFKELDNSWKIKYKDFYEVFHESGDFYDYFICIGKLNSNDILKGVIHFVIV